LPVLVLVHIHLRMIQVQGYMRSPIKQNTWIPRACIAMSMGNRYNQHNQPNQHNQSIPEPHYILDMEHALCPNILPFLPDMNPWV
jgi:hypothetical protein